MEGSPSDGRHYRCEGSRSYNRDVYFLIGADGREYGPFGMDQIRQWLAEGRANAYSRVRRDGETIWQALKAVPELAPLTERRPAPETPAAPSSPPATLDAIAEEYARRGAAIDVNRALSRAWALVRDHFLVLSATAFLAWLTMVAVALIPVLGVFVGMVVDSVIIGGLYAAFLRRIRGQPIAVTDAFAAFGSAAFLQLVLAGLASNLLVGLGLLMLIAPGIYLLVGYLFVLPLVIDKRLEFWTAMEVSRRVVHRQWWTAFALAVVLALVIAAGLLFFIVGVVVTFPVAIAALMYTYEDLFGAAG